MTVIKIVGTLLAAGSVLTFRFTTGRFLAGKPPTNSTFMYPATKITSVSGRASAWSMLPGWKRAAWRNAAVGVPLFLVKLWLIHPAAVISLGCVLAALGCILAGRRLYRWRHHRRYALPLHRALSNLLGVIHAHPREWITVPPGFDRDDMPPVRIELPTDMPVTAETKIRIVDLVRHKLALWDPVVTWNLVGMRPHVLFRPAPRPPATVGWDDIKAAYESADETAPVAGLGARRAVVTADLVADSPHIAVSAASGAGKSTFIAGLLVQGLHHGAGVVILDYKRASQKALEGLPGVVILKNIEDIHDGAVALGEEGERRNRAADEPGGHVGHRIFIAVEEWNALAGKLQKYWDRLRAADKSLPKKSPAVEALSDISFMGRHVWMHMIGVAQMLSARTTGGTETRENFATRCLARYSVNAWRMLAPEIWPMPRKSRILGRWQVVTSGEAHEIQAPYLTDAQLREWAMSGVPAPVDVLMSQRPTSPLTLVKPAGTVPAGPRLVGLREAIESGLLPGPAVELDTLRAWRKRHQAFPAVAGKRGREDLFTLDQLVAYKLRRDAVKSVGRDAS